MAKRFRYNRVLKEADFQRFGVNRRKDWEVEMALKTLRDLKATGPEAWLLGVGAGMERTIFELANAGDAKVVTASDLYKTSAVWQSWHGGQSFMDNPAAYAPDGVTFDAERIQIDHADMCDLPYADNSFDGLFSSGSIEHVGQPDMPDYEAISQAAREIGRVLKPGGIASISTEWKIRGDGWGWGRVRLFDPDLIQRVILEPGGLEMVDTPDWSFDGDPNHHVSLTNIVIHGASDVGYALLKEGRFVFTSVHLALKKPVASKRKIAVSEPAYVQPE